MPSWNRSEGARSEAMHAGLGESLGARWLREHSAQIEELKYTLWRLVQNPLTITGLVIILLVVTAAAWPALFTKSDPIAPDYSAVLQSPSLSHPFGTDEFGRDILARVVYGAGISIKTAVTVIVISLGIGVPLGITAGYLGGWVDEFIMRVTDVFLAIPGLILAMVVSATLGPSLENVLVALAFVWWPSFARLARGQAVALKESNYVEAGRAIGASKARIILTHILPNALSPIVVMATLDMGSVVLTAAGLSFLGFGAQPPTPEWGVMVTTGRSYIADAWWYVTFPGLAIFLTVMGFNLLGDGLRTILDPRSRR